MPFNLQPFGKVLIFAGIALVVVGLIFSFSGRIPFLGKLPGDIFIKKGNFSFYFPIVTCIIISILLTVIMSFFRK